MIELRLSELPIAAASFVAGRVFLQSEQVIQKKKELYQEYLDNCITAHDAYKQDSATNLDLDAIAPKGDFFLYASQEVIVLAGKHVQSLEQAFESIDDETEALHPHFKASVRIYNRMLIEMRRDVLGWSWQGLKERAVGSKRARKMLEENK